MSTIVIQAAKSRAKNVEVRIIPPAPRVKYQREVVLQRRAIRQAVGDIRRAFRQIRRARLEYKLSKMQAEE